MTAPSFVPTLQTLPELFAWRVSATPTQAAYRYFDTDAASWQELDWQSVQARVLQWQRALQTHELAPGSRVAILLPNGINHVCADLAVLGLGLVPVPMHAIDNPDSIAYILQDSMAGLLLAETACQWQAIAGVGLALPALTAVVVTQMDLELNSEVSVRALSDWLRDAAATTLPAPSLTGDSLAALVYTSGTTGRPKGVMLTHGNVMANIYAALARFSVAHDDVLLSFLPLSHTFERTVGYYLPIAAGACVAYSRSVAQLQEDLVTVKPTVLVSVPRIYERIYAKVQEAMLSESPLGRQLLDWAERIGWDRFMAQQHHEKLSLAEQAAWQVLKPTVAARVLHAFGGRLRMAIAGGAPLSSTVARFFLSLGLDLLQGYGMTETSPVVSCNMPQDNDPSSVGRALPGVQVKLGDNDELLVAGPMVMRGYWNRPQDTQRVLQADGWLHTGDQAALRDGRIYIVGRIKDIIVTSTGEKISPADLELAIEADPLFSQVLVVGEQRPFLSVLAVIDPATWARQAQAMGLPNADISALQSDRVQVMALQRVATQVKGFPSYATPKRILLLTEPWSITNGLMTPTLKLKRPALEKRFANEIAELYAHH